MTSAATDAWEAELYLSKDRKVRYAVIFGIIGYVIAIFEAVALMGLAPLKTVEPITIIVDKQTGEATVSSMVEGSRLNEEEALTQSLLFRYVRDRETYDSLDQQARIRAIDKITKGRASNDLHALYGNDNPMNPLTVNGQARRLTVSVKSVVLQPDNRALLRIEKSLYEAPGAIPVSKAFVITMRYGFDRKGTMSLEERWVNPMGFYVENYRIDEEANP
ncbi:virB8 family protein [Pelagibius sp. Alg239-R121]|uniref:virB8 family protein n=1 Tax=Pelagibius sp. Alg239-R121 TaxID=2993448 RepID=UPI0024A678AB|nr:type IV secretion system protein [Pelagibius sp. Alg239-R121]